MSSKLRNFCQKLRFFKVFLASYMFAMVEARSDQISESFSFWKRVQQFIKCLHNILTNQPRQKLASYWLRKQVMFWNILGRHLISCWSCLPFLKNLWFFKFFSAIYMSTIVEARSDQIAEFFSLWNRVQICSDFHQKLQFLKVFSASYMSVMVEARSIQRLLAYKNEFKIAPIFAKSYNFRRSF